MIIDKIQLANQYCENIEVQKVQFIQPSGFFIGIEIESFIIKYISSNYSLIFGENFPATIGNNIDFILSKNSINILKKFIKIFDRNSFYIRSVIEIELLKSNDIIEKKDCLIYLSQNLLCIETQIENIDYNIEENNLLIDNAIQFVTKSNKSKEELANYICKFIREITGFNRIYYCEFQDDGHGFVPAEDKSDETESILFHHFPASDLPYIVRKLYTKTRYRMISDANYEPIPIIGCTEKLDLSHSLFRDISSSHINYLKNMGTCASSSFSVVDGDNLKGLIGCHSRTPKSIPINLFPKLQILVESFASKIINYELMELKYNKSNFDFNISEFIKLYENSNCNILALNKEDFILLKNMFDAKFILYSTNDTILSDNNISNDFIQFFKDIFKNYFKEIFKENKIIVSNKLEEFSQEFKKYSNFATGMILIPIDISSNNYIVFFRERQIQVYKWRGDPNQLNIGKNGILNPRNSFSTWYEEIKDICIPWSNENISLASKIRSEILYVRSNYLKKLSEINNELEQKNKEIQILLGEVNHRVKNNLAIVSSLFDWKIKESLSQELSLVLKEMKSRIRAISNLHQTLFQVGNYSSLNLSNYLKLIQEDVLFLLQKDQNIEFKLIIPEKVTVSNFEALPLGLITHEFITNSLKYAFNEKKSGSMRIEWKNEQNISIFILQDDGIGCENIETIKGSSLGLELIRLLIKQINGKAVWNGSNGVTLSIQIERK